MQKHAEMQLSSYFTFNFCQVPLR